LRLLCVAWRLRGYIVDGQVVAVIGASNDRHKFGNRAVRAYQQQGYTVIPINPHETTSKG
jgi:predicted CoA-binding protein